MSGLAASSGSLSANGDGTWSFTPAADFTGTVSFSYSVSDGTGAVAGSASLQVTPVNDAPSTTPVALPATNEDSAAITITPAQLLANAGDVDGDTLSVSGLAASSGSLSANGSSGGCRRIVNLRPPAGAQNAPWSLTFAAAIPASAR